MDLYGFNLFLFRENDWFNTILFEVSGTSSSKTVLNSSILNFLPYHIIYLALIFFLSMASSSKSFVFTFFFGHVEMLNNLDGTLLLFLYDNFIDFNWIEKCPVHPYFSVDLKELVFVEKLRFMLLFFGVLFFASTVFLLNPIMESLNLAKLASLFSFINLLFCKWINKALILTRSIMMKLKI